ncbi:hypothetical protein GCM10027521_04990 [Amycolatopsis cihanbeyliensis]
MEHVKSETIMGTKIYAWRCPGWSYYAFRTYDSSLGWGQVEFMYLDHEQMVRMLSNGPTPLAELLPEDWRLSTPVERMW